MDSLLTILEWKDKMFHILYAIRSMISNFNILIYQVSFVILPLLVVRTTNKTYDN